MSRRDNSNNNNENSQCFKSINDNREPQRQGTLGGGRGVEGSICFRAGEERVVVEGVVTPSTP